MVAGLKQIFNAVGEVLDFDYKVPVSELEDTMGYNFALPVHIKGKFVNRAGIVNMSYSVTFTLRIACDRCLKEFDREFAYDFEHVVVQSVNAENDEYIVAENEKVDVNKIALSDLVLELPTKMLCSEDCKGLCPVCGCDLNESECNCPK